ncbi:MAG: beta-galactosidase [Dysgonamonadaceae bacterium]|jgi:beta-galactosidase|nr:beta-galactosidase [Dysgonamonadaceae bacterium]
MKHHHSSPVLRYLLASALLFSNIPVDGQPSPARFFPQEDLMLFGSYYYPEQWPPSQWERDLRKMSEMGFEFTHFGEFAWSTMEPEEGTYDFHWLDEAVRLADKYKLKVILCTPTPTPPAWLTDKHPDVLIVDENGTVIQHGGRQHASWSSNTYRTYVRKIVTELAKRYANNPAVWGWQLDNEPSHYRAAYDYSPNAQQKFRQWLEKKYKTIHALNDSWGNTFWSQSYNHFAQIRIPNAKEQASGKPNPHAMLDFKRFTADECAAFLNEQNDILRQYISPRQWITTNTMPNHAAVDPRRIDHLDFLTYTRYLVAGRNNGSGSQGFRIGEIHMLGYNNDFCRNIKGITGVMEIQPGQVNWGAYNPQTYPGAVRMWLYHIFAGGNRFVCNYRFRQPLKGNEQYHYGMLQTDGLSISRTGEEFVQAIHEMKTLRKHYNPKAQMPAEYAKKKTAILVNPDNQWDMDLQPQTNQWNFVNHLMKYYNRLKSLVVPVDIIDESAPLENYPVVIAPAYQLLDDALIERWKKYVTRGGHLVLTCRTGQKDREGHLWERKLSEPIYELIGATELYFDHLPENTFSHVTMNHNTYQWNNWGDVITPSGKSSVPASYTDQFYAGKAAVLRNNIGKGTVTYIGVDTDDGKLETDILRIIYEQAGATTLNLPDGLVMEWRDGFWIALNYHSDPQQVPIPDKAQIIIGQKTLPAAGVVVWKE